MVIDPQSGAILRVVVILLLWVHARLLNLPLRFLQVGLGKSQRGAALRLRPIVLRVRLSPCSAVRGRYQSTKTPTHT